MSMWRQPLSPFQAVTGAAADFVTNSFNINNFSEGFRNVVATHVKAFTDMNAYRKTMAAARKLRYNDTSDMIRQLEALGAFQNANPRLQPFMVAMPEYRTLYNKNLAAGYENGFAKHDSFRGTAYMHSDAAYCAATDGLVSDYESTHIFNWVIPDDGNGQLSAIDKVDIQINWTRMRDMDWEDGDPCSELNATC